MWIALALFELSCSLQKNFKSLKTWQRGVSSQNWSVFRVGGVGKHWNTEQKCGCVGTSHPPELGLCVPRPVNQARLSGDPLRHQKNYGLNSVIGPSPGPTQPPHILYHYFLTLCMAQGRQNRYK